MSKIFNIKNFPFFKSKLAKRLGLYIFGVAVVTAVLVGAVEICWKYHNDKKALQQEFEQIKRINIQSIEENLWILNINSLKTMLQGLLQKRNFVYFELSDDKGKTLVKVGKIPKNDFILKKVPLYYKDAYGKRVYLGTLTMIATIKYIRQDIIRNALYAIFALFMTILLVIIFILFLVWSLMSKHLLKIQEYTRDIRFDKKISPLVIDRKENHWTHNDELTSLVEAINTMQKLIQESYFKLEYQSLHDILTDLPNRRSFQIELSKRIEECAKSGKFAALYYLDLDSFKTLNDSLGHNIGDKILIEVAKRLKSLTKKGVSAYRIGGDEFIILTKPISKDREEAQQIAQQIAQDILHLFDKNININEHALKITVSIGIELFQKKQKIETIVKHADNALYKAKERGRNKVAFFYDKMQYNADRRFKIEQLLYKAIQNGDFVIYFQPKFDKERKIRSAEALTRLYQDDKSLISPGEFIPIAEETGMILEIDRQIIRQVFQIVSNNYLKMKKAGMKSIAVNISPAQFMMADFAQFIILEANRLEINPKFIILEITEEAVVSNIEHALEIMKQLKEYGFQFSIDDFGTGYSSMRYLMNFPLDELKIDKSFIDSMLDNERTVAIVKSIIALAHNLGINVVAEGVETKEQLKAICRYGDVLIQGYLFSPPLPKKIFLQMLDDQV